jgi:hypothetical protein
MPFFAALFLQVALKVHHYHHLQGLVPQESVPTPNKCVFGLSIVPSVVLAASCLPVYIVEQALVIY